MTEFSCLRCSYKWVAHKKDPVSCPYCKSYKWNINKNKEEQTKQKTND